MKRLRLLATPAGQLIAFVSAATVCVVGGVAIAGALVGVLGSVPPHGAAALASAVIAALLLAVSAYLLHQRGRSVADLGLPVNSGRLRELGFGFAVSVALFLAVAWTQTVIVGSTWQFQGAAGAVAAMRGLALAACMVIAEELLFRGVGLRALGATCGQLAAVVLSALLFGAYHLVGSGDWAMGAAFRFFTAFGGGVLFGWAALRSGGLALPIGLHLGGNWVQASLAGFSVLTGVEASQPPQALWRIPITNGDVQWLTAPDVLPRLPYFVAIALAATATLQFLRSNRGRLDLTE